MICPHQDKLIPLVAQQLTAQERDDVLAHAASCPVCSEDLAELRSTWDALGEWDIDAPMRDLTPAVLAAARSRGRSAQFGRLAAAVLLAAGAGVAAALLVPPRVVQVATRPIQQVQPSTDDLIQAMSLDSLANDPTALPELFDPELQDTEGKQ
jgi:hypothetical protein